MVKKKITEARKERLMSECTHIQLSDDFKGPRVCSATAPYIYKAVNFKHLVVFTRAQKTKFIFK